MQADGAARGRNSGSNLPFLTFLRLLVGFQACHVAVSKRYIDQNRASLHRPKIETQFARRTALTDAGIPALNCHVALTEAGMAAGASKGRSSGSYFLMPGGYES